MRQACRTLLVSVNARYSHASFAVRTLRANLGPWRADSDFLETDLAVTPLELAEQILARRPEFVCFCVYLWNVRTVTAAARILRLAAPSLRLLAGGPELTPEFPERALFDALILGEGELALPKLLAESCSLRLPHPIRGSFFTAPPPAPADLALPYDEYTAEDLASRTVYVESSRGCPYSCGYCTSANSGLRLFPLDKLLPAFDRLWSRGVRHFKFLDRSFNAPVEHAIRILDFFLPRADEPGVSLHFEINPDHLDPTIRARFARFPKGSLHLEVGLQTLNPAVARTIGRSPDTARALEEIRFLTEETGATVHADLIFGLPGEDETSFREGFNRLTSTCSPPELQVNWLKGLPGTRFWIQREELGLAFSPEPPYELLRSRELSFAALARLQRFARSWELIRNRGFFPEEVAALARAAHGDLFGIYSRLADTIAAQSGRFFAIGRARLKTLLAEFLLPPGTPPNTPKQIHKNG